MRDHAPDELYRFHPHELHEQFYEEDDDDAMEVPGAYGWVAITVVVVLLAIGVIAYGKSRAGIPHPACINYPHECAAAVTEWRL